MRRGLLVAALLTLAAGAAAQGRKPLNLKLPPPVTEGAVAAIVSVDAANTRLPTPSAQARGGQPADVAAGPPVGAVATLPLGKESDHKWRFGAAGTPEMQTRLGATSYEVTVAMDSGERRTLQRRDGNRFHVGQRVAVRQGELEPM